MHVLVVAVAMHLDLWATLIRPEPDPRLKHGFALHIHPVITDHNGHNIGDQYFILGHKILETVPGAKQWIEVADTDSELILGKKAPPPAATRFIRLIKRYV